MADSTTHTSFVADSFTEKAFTGQALDDCLVIDAHGHIGEIPFNPMVSTVIDSVVELMDRVGIDLFCVSATPAVFGGAGRGNDLVSAALQRHPGRVFGYMALDMGYADRILPEMERCLAAGFKGYKIHSHGLYPEITYDHANYHRAFEFANEHHLPVLAHTWGMELDDLEASIGRYPNINWLMAHTGSAELEKYIRFGKEYPTVFLELCFSQCPRGLVERLVSEGLTHKVIWGSDAIFMGSPQQLGRVLFAQIPPEDKRAILGSNAARALRLSL